MSNDIMRMADDLGNDGLGHLGFIWLDHIMYSWRIPGTFLHARGMLGGMNTYMHVKMTQLGFLMNGACRINKFSCILLFPEDSRRRKE